MTTIKQRRDTAANWTAANPVLDVGEFGWETNNDRGKMGDGVTAWNDLPYKVYPGQVTSVAGKTGAVTLDKDDVGLSNVDNTSDAQKTATGPIKDALDAKAPLASPTFTGDPKAPTPATTDSDTSIATTAFVKAALLAAHPVGSIYMTTVDTNPSTFLGGTWVAWGSGRVPVGVDAAQTEFDTAEETGGSKSVTIETNNLPPHTHTINHNHTIEMAHANTTGGTTTRAGRAAVGSGEATGSAVNAHSGNSGNGGFAKTPLSILQPYITCYMFKRTA